MILRSSARILFAICFGVLLSTNGMGAIIVPGRIAGILVGSGRLVALAPKAGFEGGLTPWAAFYFSRIFDNPTNGSGRSSFGPSRNLLTSTPMLLSKC